MYKVLQTLDLGAVVVISALILIHLIKTLYAFLFPPRK
jgi:hypothetical protein